MILKKRQKELLLISFFLTPALLIFFVYRILPLFWNLALSLSFWKPQHSPEFAGFYHYEELLFYDDVFRASLINTIIYMASMPAAIAMAVIVALLVNARIRGRNIYRALIFMSYPMMPVAVGVIWQWLYNERVGLINYILRSTGIVENPIAFLENTSTALPAVIVTGIWQILGFFMIIILTGLQSIPQNLYEAARIDGTTSWRQFWRITLPLLRPSLFLCFIIGIISTFTSFDLIYVMTGGGPGHATELLITYIYKTAFELSAFDYSAALTIVMFSLFLTIALIANRLSGGDAGKIN